MKTIVIYHSQTGFTRQYAQWIAEAVGAECLPLSAAKSKDLSPYDAVVFGSWACAGGISKFGWFKNALPQWDGKRLIAFCVGASPCDSPDIAPFLQRCALACAPHQVHIFYCPGGLNYDKMPARSKLMMKMFCKALSAKKDKSPAEQAMAKMIAASYDISDKKYIAPVLECLRQ